MGFCFKSENTNKPVSIFFKDHWTFTPTSRSNGDDGDGGTQVPWTSYKMVHQTVEERGKWPHVREGDTFAHDYRADAPNVTKVDHGQLKRLRSTRHVSPASAARKPTMRFKEDTGPSHDTNQDTKGEAEYVNRQRAAPTDAKSHRHDKTMSNFTGIAESVDSKRKETEEQIDGQINSTHDKHTDNRNLTPRKSALRPSGMRPSNTSGSPARVREPRQSHAQT